KWGWIIRQIFVTGEILQLSCIRGEEKMKKLAYMLLVGVMFLSLGSGNAFAQATASAALQGTVTDQSGAVIAGASVTITNKDQGWTRTTTTGDTGLYRFELLAAGSYSLKI